MVLRTSDFKSLSDNFSHDNAIMAYTLVFVNLNQDGCLETWDILFTRHLNPNKLNFGLCCLVLSLRNKMCPPGSSGVTGLRSRTQCGPH